MCFADGPKILNVDFHPTKKEAIFRCKAAFPPDCIASPLTAAGEIAEEEDELLDTVCPRCLTKRTSNFTLYLALVLKVVNTTEMGVKIKMSWGHSRCGKTYYATFIPSVCPCMCM